MQQQRRRSGIIIGLVALSLLAGAALMANQAQAVDAISPYYAEPAWDRKLACPTIANCPRFVVLTNWNREAVLDKETGLVWEKSVQTDAATWGSARFACLNKNVGNRQGWRLPSAPELASLVDRAVTPGPTLPPGHPFLNVLSANYWSATTIAEDPSVAWVVFFLDGLVNGANKAGSFQVWCVRGGMNADAY